MFEMNTEANAEATQRQLPKKGLTLATLVGMVDLGSSEKEYSGEKKMKRDLHLTFELPTQLASFGNNEAGEPNEPQPFHISKSYGMSLHPKSALHDLCINMVNSSLPEKFDPSVLVGHNLMINIVYVDKNDITYANIGSVAPLMEGVPEAEAIAPLVKYSIGSAEGTAHADLPEWMRNRIEASPEWSDIAEAEPERNPI